MYARGTCLTLALAAVGCTTETDATGSARDAVVYGTDDRVEVHELSAEEPLAENVALVAAMVKPAAIQQDGDGLWLDGPRLRDEQLLCPDVRFGDQPAVAACTAVQVANDLVLTAGHCARLCSQTRLVFGFHYDRSDHLKVLSAADVYDCADVIVDEDDGARIDYAWLRLDRPRPVAVLPPLADGPPETGDAVSLLSFPSGLPMKADRGGEVGAADEDGFVASLDAFAGSSGGPVFDDAGVLVGVLGGGAQDLAITEEGCARPIEHSTGGSERSTTIGLALDGLCEATTESELCPVAPHPLPTSPSAGCSMAQGTEGESLRWLAWLGTLAAFERRRRDRGRERRTSNLEPRAGFGVARPHCWRERTRWLSLRDFRRSCEG